MYEMESAVITSLLYTRSWMDIRRRKMYAKIFCYEMSLNNNNIP